MLLFLKKLIPIAKMAHHPVLSSGVQFACELLLSLGFNVVNWRREILLEIRELRMQLEEDIVEWWETLPPHSQHVYRDRPHPCVPLLLRLGNAIGYPNIQGLLDDVTNGFPLLGPITAGECWDDTGMWSPAHVLDKSDFLHANAAHVREGTQTRKPDKHWEEMLDTLISERGPPSWYVRTVPIDASRMTPEDYRLDPPTDLMAASFALAITSESATGGTKVRRGEDWRRSLHNATTQTHSRRRHRNRATYACPRDERPPFVVTRQ